MPDTNMSAITIRDNGADRDLRESELRELVIALQTRIAKLEAANMKVTTKAQLLAAMQKMFEDLNEHGGLRQILVNALRGITTAREFQESLLSQFGDAAINSAKLEAHDWLQRHGEDRIKVYTQRIAQTTLRVYFENAARGIQSAWNNNADDIVF